jgi:ring-1,2-phenylacetyl-CoA epoxidase subunit PaaD
VSADTRLARARAAVAAVPDPEIPALTIAELGILRGVALEGDTIVATITPSYSGCPATQPIARDVADALARAGFAHARVRTVLAPAWSTDWITETGRRKLVEAGIAPPERSRAQPPCPLCGSVETERLSAFGSTPCKALHRCLTCKEPFEAFKCH